MTENILAEMHTGAYYSIFNGYGTLPDHHQNYTTYQMDDDQGRTTPQHTC